MNVKPALQKIFHCFFPDICFLCKEKKSLSCYLCEECKTKIPEIKDPVCQACGGENYGIFEICPKCLKEEQRPWHIAVAAANYTSPIADMIKDLKYNNKTYYAKTLGLLAAEIWEKKNIPVDCVAPIPMHWTRRILRGYNQSELIAKVFSEKTGIPLAHILKRTRKTPKQANLSREERKKNLNGAFKFIESKRAKIKTGSILLLDDVLTTGSTFESACLTLLKSGACEKINILAIARG